MPDLPASDPGDTILETGATYVITRDAHGALAITCTMCGRTSWHTMDVAERCCGACGRWHKES